MTSRYAQIIPLFRPLDRHATEDELLMKARFPPSGDPERWVREGPEGAASQARNWDAKRIAEHHHVAQEPGARCDTCQFPWWPTTGPATRQDPPPC